MFQKTIFLVGRAVFFSVFAVFIFIFVFWELVSLAKFNIEERSGFRTVRNQERGNIAIKESADLSADQAKMIVGEIKQADARPVIIKRYLEKYKSPLVPYADLIFELSQTNGFEYYWMVAIAQQESNLCKKIPEDSFNCWGYGIHSKGTLRFENYELALRSYAEYLKNQYFDKGYNTPELIMKKYCPNSNGSWAKGVRQFIGEMEEARL